MPARPKDISEKRFNRWTVKAYLGKGYWLCVCDCGSEKRVWGGNLVNGKSKSCGCLRSETTQEMRTTHGLTGTVEYKVWAGIKRRCLNRNDTAYIKYGRRGITICDRWRDSFEAFLADMGKRPSAQHSIDRTDNKKGYEPSNCRWVTSIAQAQNKRNNRMITFNGITKTSSEWARITGIHRSTIEFRLDHNWSVEKSLTLPAIQGRNQFYEK